MHYYSNSALEGVVSIHIVRNVVLLRMIFNISFAILLGVIGFKIAGRVWPAAFVHGIVVIAMLIIDTSIKEILNDWMLAVLIAGTTASITALAGGLTLAYYWFRMKKLR